MHPSDRISPRHWPLMVNSLAIIAIASAMVGFGLSALFVLYDPCIMFSGVLLIGVALPLAISQYMAVFRESRRAAQIATTLLITLAAIAGISTVSTLAEVAFDNEAQFSLELLGDLAIVALVAAWMTLSAWMLWRWRREISAARLPPRMPKPGWARFSVREVLGFVTVVSIALAVCIGARRNEGPQFAYGLAPDEVPFSLPKGASDVNYCRLPGASRVYDFQIDEVGFFDWANAKIRDESRRVIVPISQPIHFSHARFFSHNEPPVEITEGYTYQGGIRGIDFAYDKQRQRAYFMSSR